jgi:P27 family predicted phage terminase small subunit
MKLKPVPAASRTEVTQRDVRGRVGGTSPILSFLRPGAGAISTMDAPGTSGSLSTRTQGSITMKNSNRKPTPPAGLSDEAKQWWQKIVADYEVDDQAGFLLLQSALEAFDDMRKAQALVRVEGITLKDRWGQQKQHPATLVLRDSRNLMLRCLKALNLDIQPGESL